MPIAQTRVSPSKPRVPPVLVSFFALVAIVVFSVVGYGIVVVSKQRYASEQRQAAVNDIKATRKLITEKNFVDADVKIDDVIARLNALPNSESERDEAARLKASFQIDLTLWMERTKEDRAAAAAAKQKADDEKVARERREREEREQAERDRREREAKEKEREAVRKQAQKMYPAYKESAEHVADEVLKVLSAVQVGVTYVKYGEMIQQLQFELNKFTMRCTDVEKTYTSYIKLASALVDLRSAHEYWKLKIDYPKSDHTELDQSLQDAWAEAQAFYKDAMAAMSKGD